MGIPVCSAYFLNSSQPRVTSRDSRPPGFASNPVWRMAVFALLVPSPASHLASSIATDRPVPARSRAIAAPTIPAPMTTTSTVARTGVVARLLLGITPRSSSGRWRWRLPAIG